MEDVVRLVLYLLVLTYSCILHECAHVWVALKLGDPTGKMEGRLTLNPLPHIDLFWTIILPVMSYVVARWPIGGPKPAPVNPLNFRDPRSGFMWTALAGPATNLLLAGIGIGILVLLHAVAPDLLFVRQFAEDGRPLRPDVTFYSMFLANLIFTNVFLAAFNLIPLPPLDGSRFLRFIVGRRGEDAVDMVERLGFIPLLIAIYFISPYVMAPVAIALFGLLRMVVEDSFADALVITFFQPFFR